MLRLLPLDLASAWGGAKRRWFHSGKEQETARRNLEIAFPELDEAQRRRLLDAQWDNLGRYSIELLLMDRLARDPARIEVVNGQRLDEIRDRGEPVVFVCARMANWDVVAMTIVRHGVACQITYRPFSNPHIDRWLVEIRRRYGVKLLASTGFGLREVLLGLRRGQSVALMADHRFGDGIDAPFFGVTAPTATGPVRLALRSSGVIQPISAQRTRGARFRVVLHEPIILKRSGDPACDVERGVKQINAVIEQWVRERPQEWVWTHRRWPDALYEAPGN